MQKLLGAVGLLGLLAAAVYSWGWPGLALAGGGIVLWLLLHFTRVMRVMQRAARRPIGHVDSAVMLASRLHAGMPLLQVVALARALGALQGERGAEPEQRERYEWRDSGGSRLIAEFAQGRLQRHELLRPDPKIKGSTTPSNESPA